MDPPSMYTKRSRAGLVSGGSPVATAPPGPGESEDWPLEAARSVTYSVTAPLTWDSFAREYYYKPGATAITQQADEFVRQGVMSLDDAAKWAVTQRNALLLAVRDQKLSPLGKAYSEWKKPRSKLPTLESLKTKAAKAAGGASGDDVLRAIIKSSSKSNLSVNKFTYAFRWAGPATIVIDIGFSAYVVATADAESRWRVSSGEAGRIVGAATFGWAGAKGGCAVGAGVGAWAAGGGAIPGCLIGGAIGAVGLGYLGSQAGESAGFAIHDWADATFEWTSD